MNEDLVLNVWLAEYDKLKAEQSQRIGFRDNLLYVTLGVFGGVASFAVSKEANYYAFLILPWTCLILGWTYLVNDEKISAIGRYIRLTLVDKIKERSDYSDLNSLFGWEIAHRSDPRRSRRKIEQLIIDEITFVVSGIVALVAFWGLVSDISIAVYILSGIEFFLLLVLGWEIVVYADLARGR
ncbi:MAG: hypothetical protein AAF171_02335 [Cyanobacteria bacterium P01_A01_bin.116]